MRDDITDFFGTLQLRAYEVEEPFTRQSIKNELQRLEKQTQAVMLRIDDYVADERGDAS